MDRRKADAGGPRAPARADGDVVPAIAVEVPDHKRFAKAVALFDFADDACGALVDASELVISAFAGQFADPLHQHVHHARATELCGVVVDAEALSGDPNENLPAQLSNGRLAAEVVCDAIEQDDGLILRRYEAELEERYDRYYKLGRLATRALGQPGLMRRITRLGIRSRTLTELTMRTATGLLRQDGRGPTHRVARAAERIASWIPDD